MNTAVQGSAADLGKVATVKIDKAFKAQYGRRKGKSSRLCTAGRKVFKAFKAQYSRRKGKRSRLSTAGGKVSTRLSMAGGKVNVQGSVRQEER